MKSTVVTLAAAIALGLFSTPLAGGAEQIGRVVRLGLLAGVPFKEMAPGISRIAVLSNPADPRTPLLLREAKIGARSLRVQLQQLEVRGPDDFERVFRAMTQQRTGALLVLNSPMFYLHRTRVANLAMKSHVPVISGLRELTVAGSLMSWRKPSGSGTACRHLRGQDLERSQSCRTSH